MRRVLIVAGTDSSGGAGLTRDTWAAAAHRCQVKPVVTAVTAQTDHGVHAIQSVPDEVIAKQISAAFEHDPPHAVKIGMIGTSSASRVIVSALKGYNVPIILDPVLKSSSGGCLNGYTDYEPLFSVATLLTPNLEEAAVLTNTQHAVSKADIRHQAQLLMARDISAVLIKGGHGQGAQCADYLFQANKCNPFTSPRLPVTKRGTGCTLSTSIACNIALGHDLETACQMAKDFIFSWLNTASDPKCT